MRREVEYLVTDITDLDKRIDRCMAEQRDASTVNALMAERNRCHTLMCNLMGVDPRDW